VAEKLQTTTLLNASATTHWQAMIVAGELREEFWAVPVSRLGESTRSSPLRVVTKKSSFEDLIKIKYFLYFQKCGIVTS